MNLNALGWTRWRKSIDEYIHRDWRKKKKDRRMNIYDDGSIISWAIDQVSSERSQAKKKTHKFVAFKSISVGWFTPFVDD